MEHSHIRHFGFLVKDVSRLWVRYFEQRAAQLGMSLSQCKVLIFLSRNEGTTQAKLAELSDTDPMTLVRILDRMERDGWIERRPDPADRRAYRLHLKPASEPVLAEILRVGEKVRNEALVGISADEREQMMSLLERVHGNLVTLLPAHEPSPPPESRATRQKTRQEAAPQRAERADSRTNRIRRRKASS
jgi:MarR family transcriptional regulator, transcriptional regulator for hemolysin